MTSSRGAPLLSHLTPILVLVLAIGGCSRFYKTGIIIDGQMSTEEKLQLARRLTTEARLVQLRKQLGERFPALTPQQLQGLGLVWSQVTVQSRNGAAAEVAVSVVIALRFSGDFDPAPVVAAAREILMAEIQRAAGSALSQTG